jgi:CBS domain-containing protein
MQRNVGGNVGAVCIREVVTAEASESVLELAQLMRRHHVGAVVIVDRKGEKNFPSGIVTDRDIVVDALVTSLENIRDMKASELVKQSVISVREDQNVDEVVAIMRDNGVRRVPVVDHQGGLVGIVAADDLVELYADRLSQLATLCLQQPREERKDRP